jgi:hypothetical protein
VDQVDYLNRMVKHAITRLLQTPQKPIIILQGDHGAACDGTSSDPTPLMVRERMSILNAIYGPPGLLKQLYPSITPVNTFRIIGDYLFHMHFSHLPDKSFYSGPIDAIPYEFLDASRWLDSEK